MNGSERWHIDGSAMNAKWRELSTTGFGVVVVARDGSLLGYGLGTPPGWVRTAPAAEAWAVYQVLSMLPEPPLMTSDCKSLPSVALRGANKATHAKAALARIWCGISSCLDGDTRAMVHSKRLQWTPAHLTQRSIGQLASGTNRVITAADGRANRLADALAKEAANEHAICKSVARHVKATVEAARFHMALLAAVTHTANNCRMQVSINGEIVWACKRDSVDRPKAASAAQRRARPFRPCKRPEAALLAEKPDSSYSASAPAKHHLACRRSAAKRKHAAMTAEATRRWNAVSQLAERLQPVSNDASGANARMDALRRRIREKDGSAARNNPPTDDSPECAG